MDNTEIIIKKLNLSTSKLVLINKNISDMKEGVKNLNTKIVTSNLSLKTLNNNVVNVNKNLLKLVNKEEIKETVSDVKSEDYLSEQIQNKTLLKMDDTNKILFDILKAVKKGGVSTVEKSGGLLGGLVSGAVTGLLGGAVSSTLNMLIGTVLGGLGIKTAGKIFGKGAGKVATKTGGKVLGKLGAKTLTKKIPGLSLLAGGVYGADKMMEGQIFEGVLEVLSGIAGTVPLVGTSASFGIDGWIAAREYKREYEKLNKTKEDFIEKDSKLNNTWQAINTDFLNTMESSFGGTYEYLKNFITGPDWLDENTWLKLYSDPDKFMKDIENMMKEKPLVPQKTSKTISLDRVTENTDTKAYQGYVEEIAKREGVDPNIIKGMVQQESSWNPNAVSPVGATGLMQLTPIAVEDIGGNWEDVNDPYKNIEMGTKYYKKLLTRFGGDKNKATAAYNAGPTAVAKNYEQVMRYPETKDFVEKVSGYSQYYAKQDPVLKIGETYEQPIDIKKESTVAMNNVKEFWPAYLNGIMGDFKTEFGMYPVKDSNSVVRETANDVMSVKEGKNIMPMKEPTKTTNLKQSSIEKDSIGKEIVMQAPPAPIITNVNNNGSQNSGYQINPYSVFDNQYNKLLFNPNFNKA